MSFARFSGLWILKANIQCLTTILGRLLNSLWKWGHFDRAKPIFKMPIVTWTETEWTDEVLIFHKRYCESLYVKGLQNYMLSKLEDDHIIGESNTGRTRVVRGAPRGSIFFRSPTLTAYSSSALWHAETHSTSFERSKPHLLTQSLSKRLETF